MKKIIVVSILCILLSCQSYAHTILLKDGRSISADKVWEEHQGYVLDEITVYACKKAKMPSGLQDALQSLKNQILPKEQLLDRIQQKIGRVNFEKYQKTFEDYLSPKIVVAYEKYGSTIKIDKSQVEQIMYDEEEELPLNMVDPGDVETRNAIQKEQEVLYKELNLLKKLRANLPAGSPTRSKYREKEEKILEKLEELKDDPLGYFLRRKPYLVNLPEKLSEEQCAPICGRKTSSVNRPTITDSSTEEWQFESCMRACTGLQKKHW